MPFGFIFKDYTMIKYQDNPAHFPIYDDVNKTRDMMKKSNMMKGYNHFTSEEKNFNKMSDVCKFLNIAPSTLTTKLLRSNKIFKNGWEIKHYYDDSPWSKIPQRVLDKIKTGNITNKPIEVKNVNTGEVLIFNTCRDAVRYFNNGSATKIWYRLKVNNTRPSKDGYLYKYL